MASVESYCKKKNLKLTEIRKLVYSIVEKTTHPLKAYDVVNELKNTNYNADPPTAYRALNFLEEHGFIHKINSLNSYVSCSHFADHHACQLFICTKCLATKELCSGGNIIKDIKNKAEKDGFDTNKICIEILGRCNKCK